MNLLINILGMFTLTSCGLQTASIDILNLANLKFNLSLYVFNGNLLEAETDWLI
jgi:hypothetical protein